jgi:hypothetical protein
MKDYPRGWKPPKKKVHRAPCPPPGCAHKSPFDYNRNGRKKEDRELIQEALKDYKDESEVNYERD